LGGQDHNDIREIAAAAGAAEKIAPPPDRLEMARNAGTASAATQEPGDVPSLTPALAGATSLKNAVAMAERAGRGQAPVELAVRDAVGPDAFARAQATVDANPDMPRVLARSIIAQPRALNAEENHALLYDRMRLSNNHRDVTAQLGDAIASGNDEAAATLRQQQAHLEDAIDANDQAARHAGREWGLGGLARQAIVRQDYSFDNLLQRARVANEGKAVPAEVRSRLQDLSAQLEAAQQRIAEHEEAAKNAAADAAVRHMGMQLRSARRGASKAALQTEWDGLSKQFRILAGRASANPVFDPEMLAVLSHMARNRVQVLGTNAAEVVDHIYNAVKDHIDGVTPRDIRDAISGYGKTAQPSADELAKQFSEVKAQLRLTSALEDAQSGQRPLKSGFQHAAPSDQVMAMRRQVQDAMRANGIDPRATIDPETQMQTALDGVKTRLSRQIDALNRQIATGEKASPRNPIQYDQEALNLRVERDRLKSIVDAAGSDDGMAVGRVKAAEDATKRAIADLESRIANKDLEPRRQTVSPWSPKLSDLKQRLGSLQDELTNLRDATKPPKDPDAIRLAALKTRLNSRAAEIQSQLSTGNFDPRPRPAPIAMDPEANQLRANVEALRRQADTEIARQRLAARTAPQRATDFLVKWRRAALLSNIPTTLKLASAGLERTALTPAEDFLGALWSHVPGVHSIAEKAPVEGGGFNTKAQVSALGQLFNPDTYRDAARAAKTGSGELDLLYGKPHPPSAGGLEGAMDFFGNIHAALKTPTKRAAFQRALQQIADYEGAHGADLSDPQVQAQIGGRAYVEANRSIFLNDNVLTDVYRNGLGYLRGSGHPNVARALEFALPIVRVPTNYAAEGLSYTAGGVKAATRITRQIFGEGLRNMKPEDADYIMRNLKKQTLGAALLTIGYMNADQIGGYYSEGDKREQGDVKPGGVRILGLDVPRFMMHTPALEALQVGATIRRAMDAYGAQGKSGGLNAGLLRSGAGVAREVPFVDTAMTAADAIARPESKGRALVGGLMRDTLVPPDVQRLARIQDQAQPPTVEQRVSQQLGVSQPDAIKRKPQSIADEIKMGIPGLRQTVPETNRGTVSRFGLNAWGEADNAPPNKYDAELQRVGVKHIDFPDQKVKDPTHDSRIKLSPAEYKSYIAASGQQSKTLLDEAMADPGYQQSPQETQQKVLEHMIRTAREIAKMQVLAGRHPQWNMPGAQP
jgi:hypothetical protein